MNASEHLQLRKTAEIALAVNKVANDALDAVIANVYALNALPPFRHSILHGRSPALSNASAVQSVMPIYLQHWDDEPADSLQPQ